MEDELVALARPTAPCPLRCAVYARVSVEDGQDKQMPSIEVQTQACRAFIEAHRHKNWLALDGVYADNGYSGGNLQRPALRRLLDDMQSNQIDVVVVHRFDRLSRSIFDLETLLPLFTIPGIRLVSVTQPLDTKSPEGRLSLHLLTSFAQFERELIGERTREKLTATRASGRWQGSAAPLGYRIDHEQRLAVVDAEAAMVRDIFQRFLDLGSMSALVEFLQQRGYKTKSWVTRDRKKRGGGLFDRNAAYRLLNNRVLIGEVYYEGEWHRGPHRPIVDLALWNRVHEVMEQRARRKGTSNQDRDLLDFPLAGRLFWHDGRAFGCFESSSRKGKRYRYYTAPTGDQPDDSEPHPKNLPCAVLHEIVTDQIRQRLRDPSLLLDTLLDGHQGEPVFDRNLALAAMKQLDDVWGMFIDKTQAQLMLNLVQQVTLYPDQMQLRWSQQGWETLLREHYRPEKPV